jgi:16S rRNA U516 pseudouridylate synthase RsuA-like enzyme
MKLRLHQFLSKTGRFASKRDLKEAVWAGDVTVNGSVVKDIAFQFNPAKKEVQFKGETLRLPSDEITLCRVFQVELSGTISGENVRLLFA